MSYSYYTPEQISEKTDEYLRDRHWFRYLGLVEQLLKDLVDLYPGWRMRIYHNVTQDQADQAQYLCQLYCNHQILDLCDVRDIPELVKHQVKHLSVKIIFLGRNCRSLRPKLILVDGGGSWCLVTQL